MYRESNDLLSVGRVGRMTTLMGRLLCLLVAMLLAQGVVMAQTYISEVAVVQSDDAYATELNYTIDGQDLNKSAGGYTTKLCFKMTSKAEDGITDLVVLEGSQFSNLNNQGPIRVNGRMYYPCKGIRRGSDNFDANLNLGTNGEHKHPLYLWYTKEKPEMGILNKVWANESQNCNQQGESIVQLWDMVNDRSGGNIDTNWGNGSGSKYIYIHQVKGFSATLIPQIRQNLRLYDLGGGLYQLTLPLAYRTVMTGKQNVFVLGGGTNKMTLAYLPENADNKAENWVQMISVGSVHPDNPANDKEFEADWHYDVDISDVNGSYPFEVLQSETLDRVSGSIMNVVADGGNRSDLKTVSYWIRMKEGVKPHMFRIIPSLVKLSDKVETESGAVDFFAHVPGEDENDNMNIFNVMEPQPDLANYQNKEGTTETGGLCLHAFTANQMKTVAVWDATDRRFLHIRRALTTEKNFQFVLSPKDKEHRLAFLAYGEYKSLSELDGKLATTKGNFSKIVVQKPLHEPHLLKDTEFIKVEKSIDNEGRLQEKHTLSWRIAYNDDEDLMEGDEWIVQRSYYRDFTDAQNVQNISIKADSVKEIDGIKNGLFTYADEDEESWYNPKAKDREPHKIYYRVTRAMVMSLMKNNDMGKYAITDSVMLDNYLPVVSQIKLKKQASFDQDHSVKVRVEMKVPTECRTALDLNDPEQGQKILDRSVPFSSTQESIRYYIIDPDRRMYLSAKGDEVVATTSLADAIPLNIKYLSIGKLAVCQQDDWSMVLSLVDPSDLSAGVIWKKCDDPGLYSTMTNDNSKFQIITSDNYHYFTIDENGYGSISPHFKGWIIVPARDIEDQVELKWQSMWDEKARINLHRFSPKDEHYQGRDYAEKKLAIQGRDMKWDKDDHYYYGEIEDVQMAPYLHYYYTATVDNSQSYYPKKAADDRITTSRDDADSCYSETLAPIRHFQATLGTQQGRVVLEWETDEGLIDEFVLVRRQHGVSHWNNCDTLQLKNKKDLKYVDETAKAGILYDYRLTAICNLYGQTHYKSAETYGWNSYYGTIRGRVQLENGSAMPGQVQVEIKGKAPVRIPEVVIDGQVVIPAYSTDRYTAVLNTTDGTYEFDEVPYGPEGTAYEINVVASGASFKVAGSESNVAQTTLADGACTSTNTFVCSDTHSFHGTIEYANSTIPVPGCYFLVNGYPVLDANGNTIVTDNKGYYSFRLPTIQMDVQVCKDGHTFADDGYVQGTEADRELVPVADRQQNPHLFKPTKDYTANVKDNTTIRLVGRLIGGNRQGDLPAGFGLTKNNLGDDLRLVMELEGDPSSQIVFYKDNPSLTTRVATFEQEVRHDAHGEISYVDTTEVSFEKKRIVIRPNVRTGEFCLDLAPTRYKITEMSAHGYATLFMPGEGAQVLDLTNDIVVEQHQLAPDVKGSTDTLRTAYNRFYQRVVHSDVNVTYTQSRYGMEQGFLGSESIYEMNLAGTRVKAQVATYDKKSGKTSYMFGYPIYEEGREYTLHIRAHEDYYYNNEKDHLTEVVYLKGGTAVVRNGLVGSESETIVELDDEGSAEVTFVAGNPNFTVTEKIDEALRSLNVQVKTNGYYYNAAPLRALVTGSRDKGRDIITVDGGITLVDIIRDPYGSNSSAYREAGTTYHWDNTLSAEVSVSIDMKHKLGTKSEFFTGVWAGMGTGGWGGISNSGSTFVSLTTPIPLYDYIFTRKAEYNMALNTRIETSSDSRDVGAMADVYLGTVNSASLGRIETISVIDSLTHSQVLPAIESGAIKVICSGQDAQGKDFYLVISEKVGISKVNSRTFAHSQKYILGTLIPELAQTYKSLILTGSHDEIQALANSTGQVKYRLKDGKTLMDEDHYEAIFPDDVKSRKPETINPASCAQMISNWIELIAKNEEQKIIAMSGNTFEKYSVDAGASIQHTESAGWYNRSTKVHKLANFNLSSGELSGKLGLNMSKELGGKDKKNSSMESSFDAEFEVPGSLYSISIVPNLNFDVTQNGSYLKTQTAGTGYTLSTNDNNYLDIDVYKVNPEPDGDFVFSDDNWTFVSTSKNDATRDSATVKDFVFTVRGGAQRQPWYAPDSTLFFLPGTPLCAQTMKIDNPKIYIDQPVMSNVPTDERATFVIRLTNETEVPYEQSNLNASSFHLFLDDDSAPDGAAIYMDGMPLTDGREFILAPGKTLTKTIQVERCGTGYNYDNLRLGFRDDACSLYDYATVSVHYLPTSTPLKMITPTNKWVMNTQSSYDEQHRYYIPVEISGFDTHKYENFDHIELQYKKKTEGDSKWVNLCSFFADRNRYDAYSGQKAMIDGGTIAYRFYGDADPMEMEYDLRAVSFCRLGSGFVTRNSEVMSGLKDTRNPEIFGVPKPTNGVLSFEDVISFPFNEPIAYNYLNKTSNFQILGFTNGKPRSYDTSLHFDAADGYDVPMSKINRNLTGQDFTIDLMVKLSGQKPEGLFFGVMNDDAYRGQAASERYMAFYTQNNRLHALFDGMDIVSDDFTSAPYKNKNLSLSGDFANVAMSYRHDATTLSGAGGQIHFYINGYEVGVDDTMSGTLMDCRALGKVVIGSQLTGNLSDIRLWNRELSAEEINNRRGKRLNGTEVGLLGYWPMDEMAGTVLHDKANGADLYFDVQQWQMPDGQHSLRLDADVLQFTNKENFYRAEFHDYTFTMWLKVDQIGTGNTEVFHAGGVGADDYFGLCLNEDDFFLQSGQFVHKIANRNQVMDGRWHNVMVVANRTQNSAAIYLDGSQMVQMSGTELSRISNNTVALGSNGFHGNVDNLTFWHLALPYNSLEMLHNAVPNGNEYGLMYNLPFEMDKSNSQDMYESVFSLHNHVFTISTDTYERQDSLSAMVDAEVLADSKLMDRLDDRHNYPVVKTLTGIENLDFGWTATNNELQINIKKKDAEINHQQLFVTVRGVEDLAGNSMQNPQMMTVYVDRNVLVWDKQNLEVTVPYGESLTLPVAWRNKSGRRLAFSIENNDSWLTVKDAMGIAHPLAEGGTSITISEYLAPGTYTATLSLVDEDLLSTPMTIIVNVVADEPDWYDLSDDPDHNYLMQLIGRVKIKNQGGIESYDMDHRDIVAAFYGEDCITKTYVKVDNASNTSNVYMTMHGTKQMCDAKVEISFRLWRASTNEIYYLKPDTPDGKITYANNKQYGCPPDAPVTFTVSDEQTQIFNFKPGWTFASLNIKGGTNSTLKELFLSVDGFTVGDKMVFDSKVHKLVADASGKKSWSLDDRTDLSKVAFKVYVQKPVRAIVHGEAYKESERFVTIKSENDDLGWWNFMPYLLNHELPVRIALADYNLTNAKVGTQIKSHNQFAILDEHGNWVGSLEYLRPGIGYYIRHYIKGSVDVHFYDLPAAQDDPVTSAAVNQPQQTLLVDGCSEHAANMPVIARMAVPTDYEEGDVIVAYTRGEMVGIAQASAYAEGEQRIYLSVNAEDGDVIRFAHFRGDEVMGTSSKTISYDGNGIAGTLHEPIILDFSPAEGQEIFDLQGIRQRDAQSIQDRHGVFIVNGQKQMK